MTVHALDDILFITVRPLASDGVRYEVCVHNDGDAPLNGLMVVPDAILSPEHFGYDSTYFPRAAHIPLKLLAPGGSETLVWSSHGIPAHYQGPAGDFRARAGVLVSGAPFGDLRVRYSVEMAG